MRILNILSGVSVLLTAMASAHLLHHHVTHEPKGDATFWALMLLGVAITIFSFIGGCLLLRRAR